MPVILVTFHWNLNFLDKLSKKNSKIKFHEYPSVQWEPRRAMRADRATLKSFFAILLTQLKTLCHIRRPEMEEARSSENSVHFHHTTPPWELHTTSHRIQSLVLVDTRRLPNLKCNKVCFWNNMYIEMPPWVYTSLGYFTLRQIRQNNGGERRKRVLSKIRGYSYSWENKT